VELWRWPKSLHGRSYEKEDCYFWCGKSANIGFADGIINIGRFKHLIS
jgi:prepilin-type processing-associated H-X9-DG protein